MADTPPHDSGRTASRVVLIGVVVVVLVGAFVWWQGREKSCDRWREDVRSLAVDFQAAIDRGNADPPSFTERAIPLIEGQPSGCPRPSTILDPVFDSVEG